MICPKCGVDNLAGKLLCYKCGTKLLQAPDKTSKQGKRRGKGKKKRGCWKGCLTGCLVIILVIIGSAIAIWISRDKVGEFFLDKMERIALSIVSEEVDKGEVEEVIAEVKEALEEGDFDPEKLKKASEEMAKYMTDGKLDKEETDQLIEMFREAIGVTKASTEEGIVKESLPEKKPLTREEREEIKRKREKNEANSWLQLGDNFASVRKYALALEYYRKVIDKYPESEQAREARKRIKEVKAELE